MGTPPQGSVSQSAQWAVIEPCDERRILIDLWSSSHPRPLPYHDPTTINDDGAVPRRDNCLKHQKPLLPVTWDNVLKNLNWLYVGILGLTPLLGFIGACYTHLRWETAIWAVTYYYMTGLGSLSCCFLRGRASIFFVPFVFFF